MLDKDQPWTGDRSFAVGLGVGPAEESALRAREELLLEGFPVGKGLKVMCPGGESSSAVLFLWSANDLQGNTEGSSQSQPYSKTMDLRDLFLPALTTAEVLNVPSASLDLGCV